MVGIVIAAHGSLGRMLLETAQAIVGKIPQAAGLDLNPDGSVEEIRSAIESAIGSVDSGEGVLVFTDLFGGTATNLSLPFLERDKVEVLTGVNLPMLLKVGTEREGRSLRDLSRFLKSYGQRNIYLASEVLEGRKAGVG